MFAPPSPSPSPESHPMDPRRGRHLSPSFTALMCWLLDLSPMAKPAIVGVAVTADCVYVATTEYPFHNHLLGTWEDCEANLRGWGAACEAPPETVEALIAKVREGGG